MGEFLLKYWDIIIGVVILIVAGVRAEMKIKINSKDIGDLKKDYEKNHEKMIALMETNEKECKDSLKGVKDHLDECVKDIKKTISDEDQNIIEKIEKESQKLDKRVVEVRQDNNQNFKDVYDRVDSHMENLNEKFLRKDVAGDIFVKAKDDVKK